MIRSLVVCAAVACLTGVRAQPVSCRYDDQCPSGSYCNSELLTCLGCLSCESLKREPPTLASKCVRYVAECGTCLPGLVASSDGSDGCVEETSEGLPAYAWAVIGVCLVLFLAFVSAVLVYILRHTETFKILTSATSVETQRSPREVVAATAPPPYNGHFEPMRPSSPPAPNAEAEAPLVKRAGSDRQSGGARESAASQAARVFNNPAYVRGPHLPPPREQEGRRYGGERSPRIGPLSLQRLPSTPENRRRYEEAFSSGSDTEAAFVPPPDEDTMESMWTPAGDTHTHHHTHTHTAPHDTEPSSAAAASSSEAGVAVALVRRPSRSEHAPPAKIHCVREDTNNNRGGGGGGARSGSRSPPAPPTPPRAPSLVINVLNVNTVTQHPYDVTL